MHFVNASQIGPRKFIGTLGNQKNRDIRSPIKSRKSRDPPNEGCCTKLVAWVHIVVHISLILLSLLMVLALILNGKSDGTATEDTENLGTYNYLWQLNSSHASIKTIIYIIVFCFVGSLLGLGMSIVLLTAEKERNVFKLKLWILYTIVIVCILIPCCIWQFIDGPFQQGKLWVIVALFTSEIFFLWVVAAFIKKIQETPVPPTDSLIAEV